MKPMNCFFSFLLLLLCAPTYAQSPLDRKVSLDVRNQRLDRTLELLSNRGGFYFSYNSSILRGDSLVSLSGSNIPVKGALDLLFSGRYEYRQNGNYIILKRAPARLTLVTAKAVPVDKIYTVTGYVLDNETGEMVQNASIYEKRLLASALTNENGYFRLRLKDRYKTAALTVSKELYEDTTVTIEPRMEQQVSIAIEPLVLGMAMVIVSPEDYFVPDSLRTVVALPEPGIQAEERDSLPVERTRLGRFLLSPGQKIQTANLKRFFTERPFQVSLTPGLSTHGKLSGQVINHFSLNVFGGYSGGVDGLEIGGLFNIDKKEVRYVQIGGLFNIAGGRTTGLQIGGLSNTVLDSVSGVQIGGLTNMVKGKMSGLQVAGLYNHVTNGMSGVQIGGIGSFVKGAVSGQQIGGVFTIGTGEVRGLQAAGVFNYAKKLKGVQVGLINISDSSEGYSIGLINIVFKGYHKLALSYTDVLPYNAAFKTGNSRLYSILQAGADREEGAEAYAFGYGIGRELRLGRTFSLNPELVGQNIYLGSWDHVNLLGKAQLDLHVKLGRWVSFSGGPSFQAFYSNQSFRVAGYRSPAAIEPMAAYKIGGGVKGWIGWNAGIHFF